MASPERSTEIFKLAETTGLLEEASGSAADAIQSLQHFRELYTHWANIRDAAIIARVTSTPTLLRCYLPPANPAFAVAYQVVWYFDEILIADPILLLLNHPTDDTLADRERLRRMLLALQPFRTALESGYLLLAGDGVLLPESNEIPGWVDSVLSDEQLCSELDRTARFGFDIRYDSCGGEVHWGQVVMDFAHTYAGVGKTPEEPGREARIALPHSTDRFPVCSAERIVADFGEDVFQRIIKGARREEVHRAMHALVVGASLPAAILYYKDVHRRIIAAVANKVLDPRRQHVAVTSLNLALPYVEGIPPGRLVDVRNAMPSVFREFRAHVVDIVLKAMNEDPSRVAEMAQIMADKDLGSQFRSLQTDLEATARKARILGYGLPCVASVGALIGKLLGYDAAAFGLLLTGAGSAVTAAADSSYGRKKAECNPFYFLWRAKHG